MKRELLLLFLLGLSVSGQAQSGILLGIHISHSASSGDRYKTYWITTNTDGPRLAAILPDLVVPRKDGFWRVGIYQNSFSERYEPGSLMELADTEARYFENQEAKLYAVPVGQTPKVNVTADDPQPAAVPKKSAGGEPTAAEDDDNSGQPCSVEDVTITYLGPQNIGLMQRSSETEFCAPGRYATFGSNVLAPIDQLQAPAESGQSKGIVIMDMLTAAQKRVVRKTVTAENDADYDSLTDVSLTLAHAGGNWMLVAWWAGGTASRGGEDFPLNIPAPTVLVHSAQVPQTVQAQLKQVKDLQDYFVSPTGDFLVAIVGRKLIAYRVVAGRVSVPVELVQLVKEDIGQAVPVMAEWAIGKHVAAWDQQMKELKLLEVEAHAVKAQR